MAELTGLVATVKAISELGLAGTALIFMWLLWKERRAWEKKDLEERQERETQAREDRLILTNHLTEMLKADAESRSQLSAALTNLADSINHFQRDCLQLQAQLRDEIERLGRLK